MKSTGPSKAKKAAGQARKSARGSSSRTADGGRNAKHYLLRLYVAGQTPRSLQALSNLRKICDQHLSGLYKVEVIDLLQTPQLAAGDQILAIPTLVRPLPKPARKIIGDLSNTERVLVGLDVQVGM